MLEHLIFEFFWLVIFVVAFVHLYKRKGLYTACLFLLPAVIWSFLVELSGVHLWGIYSYSPEFSFIFLGVPLAVALGWASIKHFGYYFVTEIWHPRKWFKKDVETAFVATGIDFIILEPFAFIFKWWAWNTNSGWFGAPLFNFIGWFLIITIYLAAYHFVVKKYKNKKKRALCFIGLLVIGFIILNLVSLIYLTTFGSWI
jgi:uncharacterized membrane protein